MIHILFINYSNDIGGAEKSLLDILQGIDRDQYSPSLLTFGSGSLSSLAKHAGIDVIEVPDVIDLSAFRRDRIMRSLIKGIWKLPAMIRQILYVRNAIRHRPIDIIHTNNPKSHVIGTLASMRLHKKIVFHMRDIFLRRTLSYLLFSVIGKWAKPVCIAISQSVLASLPKSLQIHASVIYNGFHVPVIRKERKKVRDELGISGSEMVVISVGRIVPWKGYDVLVKAMATILKHQESRLIIVGDVLYWESSYLEKIKGLARDLGVFESVIFTGFVEDVNSLISASDLFILPSTQEPFGRVLVEAMLCQVPVIAFRSGGPIEIIEDNRTGILVESRDAERLGAAIDYILLDKEKRESMGIEARRQALKRFPMDKMISRLEALYRSMFTD
jgi:glycosyltransferase involved in cell wall biosynthesis